jgi:Protein of unknown function (DUF3618)
VRPSERSTEGSEFEGLERDLSRTRARLGATLDALRRELAPGRVADLAVSRAKGSGVGAFGRNLAGAVHGHPVPVAFLGIGLAWLMLADRRGRGERRPPRPGR